MPKIAEAIIESIFVLKFSGSSMSINLSKLLKLAERMERMGLKAPSNINNAVFAFTMNGQFRQAMSIIRPTLNNLEKFGQIKSSNITIRRLRAKLHLHAAIINFMNDESYIDEAKKAWEDRGDLTQAAFAGSYFCLIYGDNEMAKLLFEKASFEHPNLAKHVFYEINQGYFSLWLMPTYSHHNAVLQRYELFEEAKDTFKESCKLTPASQEFFLKIINSIENKIL